jgi:hypothetical protein
VSLAHFRTWRRLSLLAAEALAGDERERALAHVAACARCAAELALLRRTLDAVAADPACSAEPAVDIDALVRLTRARIERLPAGGAAEPRGRLRWVPAAAAAALAAAVIVPAVVEDLRARRGQPARAAALEVSFSGEALRRLERTVEREQAARYLDEAEAVLVTVAAIPQRCDRNRDTLDLAEERRRSRELLTRRALLVDFDGEGVRSARPVLEDVERVLREVAALDPCAKPEELLAIHEELRDRRLLMKIGLMTRELLG